MKKIPKQGVALSLKEKSYNSFQDLLFIIGIIVFISILVIALFPGKLEAGLVDENFLITAMTTIPITAAIYFLIISFRRSLNIKSIAIRESIKKKITLSFVFIAALSTMPIVIISNSYFSNSLSKMFSGRTMKALDKSVELTGDINYGIVRGVEAELETVEFLFNNFMLGTSQRDIEKITKSYRNSNIKIVFFKLINGKLNIIENDSPSLVDDNYKLYNFYKRYASKTIRTDRLEIDGVNIISGMFWHRDLMIVMYLPISENFMTTESLLKSAREDYKKIEDQKEYFESGLGSFFMLMSVITLGIAYLISLFISGNITHPVMELSAGAKQIAIGNNKLHIERKSDDEIGVLVDAFNSMAEQLDENQKIMFQKQKLEAWNEIARSIVHEIKNPLTPIRLSAERMRKLVIEGNPNMNNAVITGSETIVKEVNSLLNLISEFNAYARLPEKREELTNLNKLIDDTIQLFNNYENVEFKFAKDESLPDIMIDRSLIRQALNNIINNSIHAVNESGLIIITSSLDETGLYQVVKIQDNGPGISPENLSKIFEPGFTLKSSGSGLGLAIVEKIILEHNGKINYKSVEGKGTEFVLSFSSNIGAAHNG
ncbi:MAG: ATP-binding protein [Leptospirales bacterium]|nr:ATP-binding protein [Leptospirales bacterium]